MNQSRPARRAMTASLAVWAMVPIGFALIAIGVIEVRWWHSAGTAQLFKLFAKVKADNGLAPPRLLRDSDGAVGLIVLGAMSLGYASLAPFVRKGSHRACWWGLPTGLVLLVYALTQIGADATTATTIEDYLYWLGQLKPLPGATAADFIPLFPHGWYSWFEDLAQGVQALAFVGALIALVGLLLVPAEQALTVREQPADDFGRALQRFADSHRAAEEL
jgi:uncharacterized membrane protein